MHTALTKGRNDGDRLPGCAGSAVSAISCMTADKLFNFFVPQFPDLRYGVAIVPNCKAVPRIMWVTGYKSLRKTPNTGWGQWKCLLYLYYFCLSTRGFVSYLNILAAKLLSHFSRVRLCVIPQTAATRLPRPWDSPGKNTGVGCHCLLQCMKVKSEREVAQSCPTLSDPMDCSLPGASIHGLFPAKYWSGVPLPSPQYQCQYPWHWCKHLAHTGI